MMDGRGIVITFAFFTPIILLVAVLGWAVYSDLTTPYKDVEFELYSCDAPDGHYYTDVHGGHWYMDSNLGNSYVMRYIDSNGELKTIIIDSTSEHLHTYLYKNGTDTMHIRIHYQFQNTNGTYESDTDYYLYVPDPKTM